MDVHIWYEIMNYLHVAIVINPNYVSKAIMKIHLTKFPDQFPGGIYSMTAPSSSFPPQVTVPFGSGML